MQQASQSSSFNSIPIIANKHTVTEKSRLAHCPAKQGFVKCNILVQDLVHHLTNVK